MDWNNNFPKKTSLSSFSHISSRQKSMNNALVSEQMSGVGMNRIHGCAPKSGLLRSWPFLVTKLPRVHQTVKHTVANSSPWLGDTRDTLASSAEYYAAQYRHLREAQKLWSPAQATLPLCRRFKMCLPSMLAPCKWRHLDTTSKS